ncbi:histidine kinase OS=Streptomyces tendae OX=1932 GN=GUR47_34865 PE=4 SV=1 [Streptomyces tendae]
MAMSSTPPVRRLRLGLPRRVFSQVLLMQLAIAAGVAVLATGLFLAPLGDQLDDQAMRRALAIAQTTAQQPQVARDLRTTRPTATGPVQREAERVREATQAEYVVVMDREGVRWSHTDPRRIGQVVSTDPGQALSGHEVMEIDNGTLGRSARGKVPLRDSDGEIVGAVSVGIAYDSVRARLIHAIPGLFAYAGGALAVGALASWIISRRVQRQTRDLAFSDIAGLLAEREAMLHGIREGVVAVDRGGRVRLLNHEAQRLLGIGGEAVGRSPDEALGAGRTADVLAGRVTGTDLLTVRGQRVLVANRMPTDDGGAVATLRDRTELEQLGRELDSTRGLIDALRAQDHEHANRMHTLLGLLELEVYDDAVEFVGEVVGDHPARSGVADGVQDPLLAALLVRKATVTARPVGSRTGAPAAGPAGRSPRARDDRRQPGRRRLDAAADRARGGRTACRGARRHAHRARHGPRDSADHRELVFTPGWSGAAGPPRARASPSLVRRLAERQGGSATYGGAATNVLNSSRASV